jgi:hypothetical protein
MKHSTINENEVHSPIPKHAITGAEPISPVSDEPSSPPPLPFLWRMPSTTALEVILESGIKPDMAHDRDIPNGGVDGETPMERGDGRPVLHHRRSSLKSLANRPSVNDIKRVSWAADRDWVDQMERYEKAAREVRDEGGCFTLSI